MNKGEWFKSKWNGMLTILNILIIPFGISIVGAPFQILCSILTSAADGSWIVFFSPCNEERGCRSVFFVCRQLSGVSRYTHF